jgi:hypothetical protein
VHQHPDWTKRTALGNHHREDHNGQGQRTKEKPSATAEPRPIDQLPTTTQKEQKLKDRGKFPSSSRNRTRRNDASNHINHAPTGTRSIKPTSSKKRRTDGKSEMMKMSRPKQTRKEQVTHPAA